jgi:hypothetical protein
VIRDQDDLIGDHIDVIERGIDARGDQADVDFKGSSYGGERISIRSMEQMKCRN